MFFIRGEDWKIAQTRLFLGNPSQGHSMTVGEVDFQDFWIQRFQHCELFENTPKYSPAFLEGKISECSSIAVKIVNKEASLMLFKW